MSGIKTGSPLLAINIPIYNRNVYLERMLSRFLEDQDLFEEKVSLYISDNCSEESLSDTVQAFQDKGLKVDYHRNETNVGGDGNIVNCFRREGGRYVWVLGSDDVPCPGVVREIVRVLESGPEYGVMHVSSKVGEKGLTEYDEADVFFETIHVWVTFISGNIVNQRFISQVPLEKYLSTSFAQVPLYLTAGFKLGKNAVLSLEAFENETDASGNGGYNIFRVFCDNLLGLLQASVKDNCLSQASFLRIKKAVFKDFTVKYIIPFLIVKRKNNFDVSGAWGILFRNYGRHLYSYWFLLSEIVSVVFKKLSKQF